MEIPLRVTSYAEAIHIDQAEDDFTKINTDLLERSSIKIRLDITNQHIAYTLQMRLVEAFQHFLEQLVRFSERN